MDDFEILVESGTFKLASLGHDFTGTICVRVNDRYFPDDQWNDYILMPLSIWTYNFRKLLEGASDMAKLMFIDGSYEIEARLQDRNLALKFVERLATAEDGSIPWRVYFTAIVPAQRFVEEMMRILQIVLGYAHFIQLENSRVKHLQDELEFFLNLKL